MYFSIYVHCNKSLILYAISDNMIDMLNFVNHRPTMDFVVKNLNGSIPNEYKTHYKISKFENLTFKLTKYEIYKLTKLVNYINFIYETDIELFYQLQYDKYKHEVVKQYIQEIDYTKLFNDYII